METEPNITGSVFAGCKIIAKLGQGGMGSVYKAHQEALDKFVCVKLLSPELARDPRNIEFFLREARSAAKLEHPNIVHVYNFGQENGSYFIVMSYVEGKSLQDLVAAKGPLPVEEATRIISGVLAGLAHAHSNSIIHRDIKPSNILVGTDNIPRIVDFGLARSITEEKQLTMAGEMVGTAYFMSPEQGLAAKVDNRADLYAAGATYFYILTGKYPFDGKSSIEVIHKHISDPVPNVVLLRPDVPLWAARVIERLMRKKPEERYQTAGEVTEALRKYSSGEASVANLSQERTFDLPDVTSRIESPVPAQQASLERASLQISDRSTRARKQPQEPVEEREKPTLQLTALHNALKAVMHLALTLSGTGCFILAGASGKTSGSLLSPLSSNPAAAGALAAAGLALFGLALWQKPLKITFAYTAFLLGAAAAAYGGGAYIPAPPEADAVLKGFLAIRIGFENMFSGANIIVYALFFYLAASKAVFIENWAVKTFAVAAYIAGLTLTYSYFKAGTAVTPEQAWLAAAGALALLGAAAAVTQKEFFLFFNPQLIFLAANLAMFAMFTTPQIEAITAEKVRADSAAVASLNRAINEAYQRALTAAPAEALYDLEGRPIEAKPAPQPEEIKPAEKEKLRAQARTEYYTTLWLRIREALAASAGIIFIAFFLALMANACFIEELITAYRERELF